MTSEGSFLSRLTIRFLEVFAAGLATAVSGYLIAHFAGYLAAPTPPQSCSSRRDTTGRPKRICDAGCERDAPCGRDC